MAGPKTQILLIDDDPSITNLIRVYLSRRAGFDVVCCDSGLTGVELAESLAPDLILLDWMMPEFSGIKTLSVLRSKPETRDIPILMLTGKNLIGEVEKAFSRGVDAYLTKPVELPRLESRLHQMLAAKARAEESSVLDSVCRILRIN